MWRCQIEGSGSRPVFPQCVSDRRPDDRVRPERKAFVFEYEFIDEGTAPGTFEGWRAPAR